MSQIASIFVLVAVDSVGIAFAPRLHDSTAEATAEFFCGALVAVELGVVALVALLLVELLLELLELELELPQPVSSATAASGINSHVESVRII